MCIYPMGKQAVAEVDQKQQNAELQAAQSPSNDKVNKVYREVMRRVKQPELIERYLGLLQNRVKRVEDLLNAMNERWTHDHPVYNDPLFPFVALLALKQEKLTQNQFGTLMLFDDTATHFYGDKRPLSFSSFDDPETINKELAAHPNKDMKELKFKGLEECLYVDKTRSLDDTKLAKFKTLLSHLPKMEQTFLLVPDEWRRGSVVWAIENNARINLFNHYIKDTLSYKSAGNESLTLLQSCVRIIPSVGMVQAFLTAMHGETLAVRINPVLGLSSTKDLRLNGLTGTRDMGLHFPYIKLPNKADNFDAPGPDFSYHDMYHALQTSYIPPAHRQLMVEIYDQLNDLRSDAELREFRFSFIDMEYGDYRPAWGISSLDKKFWVSVARRVSMIKSAESQKLAMDRILNLLAEKEIGKKAQVTKEGLLEGISEEDERVKNCLSDLRKRWHAKTPSSSASS